MCVPSEADQNYLTIRCTKSVPSQLFVECLIHHNVEFVRLTNFGMKENTDQFVTFDEAIASCAAEACEYPPNYWDVSFSKPVAFIFTITVENRYLLPDNLQLERYIIFTPLDDRLAPDSITGVVL